MYHSNNGRGATLLPVINKIFCRILLEQIKIGVDRKFPKEQTGFRSQRRMAEQIFILINILEQVNECRAGLYSHFEKAFDSALREILSNITKSCGIPGKTSRVIADTNMCSY